MYKNLPVVYLKCIILIYLFVGAFCFCQSARTRDVDWCHTSLHRIYKTSMISTQTQNRPPRCRFVSGLMFVSQIMRGYFGGSTSRVSLARHRSPVHVQKLDGQSASDVCTSHIVFFSECCKKKSPSIFKKKKMADNIEQPHPMEPAEWGRSAWKFLHACSFAFPENPSRKQRESALAVFNNLGDILPCPICRGHYKENIAVNPPRVSSKQELSHWLVELHNSVNKSRRAKEVDFDTVQRH